VKDTVDELKEALADVDSEVLEHQEEAASLKVACREAEGMIQSLLSWLRKIDDAFVAPDRDCRMCSLHCFLKANRKGKHRKPAGRPSKKTTITG